MPSRPPAPIRTCVGCRTRRGQDELIRLRLDDLARVEIDRAGPGRGAWLCATSPLACLDQAIERRALSRALRRRPDGDSVEALRLRLHAADGVLPVDGNR